MVVHKNFLKFSQNFQSMATVIKLFSNQSQVPTLPKWSIRSSKNIVLLLKAHVTIFSTDIYVSEGEALRFLSRGLGDI